MSSVRYIEIDSTFRNRNEWPLPSEFEMLIAQTGTKGQANADDPVSRATNIIRWTGQTFDTTPGSATVTGTIITSGVAIQATGDQQILIIEFTVGEDPQIITDYYVGAILATTSLGTNERRRITASKFLKTVGGTTTLQITVDSAFSSAVVDSTTIEIIDATDLTDDNNPLFFVPNGRRGTNAYPECLLYNETRSLAVGTPVWRTISNYDVNTHLLTVDTTESIGETNSTGPVTSWNPNDIYSIRKELPVLGTTVAGTALNNNITSTNVASLPISFPNQENFYRNSWIRMINGSSSEDIRRIIRYETYSGNAVSGSATTVQFPATSSSISGYYNGAYIQILSGVSIGNVRKIISYDATTRIATVNAAFTGAIVAGVSFTFRSLYVSPSFSSTVTSNDQFEILIFSYDNHNPFIYTGSLVSQQEMVCYEIELLNLILPNKTLDVGFGSRISFYKYVYVEISNVSGAGAGLKNIIYSNNPNSNRMIFRATIDDVPNPIISSFIKIDGDGMTQTIKFKPNDNLRFSVHLSNGQVYRTLESENYGPSEPNAEIQISALFSIKRL